MVKWYPFETESCPKCGMSDVEYVHYSLHYRGQRRQDAKQTAGSHWRSAVGQVVTCTVLYSTYFVFIEPAQYSWMWNVWCGICTLQFTLQEAEETKQTAGSHWRSAVSQVVTCTVLYTYSKSGVRCVFWEKPLYLGYFKVQNVIPWHTELKVTKPLDGDHCKITSWKRPKIVLFNSCRSPGRFFIFLVIF